MKRVNIAVSQGDLPDFKKIVSKCREAGLKVEQELDTIGIIGGTVEESKIDEIRGIVGVESVEEDREVKGI